MGSVLTRNQESVTAATTPNNRGVQNNALKTGSSSQQELIYKQYSGYYVKFLALKSFLVVFETCNLMIFKDQYDFSLTFLFSSFLSVFFYIFSIIAPSAKLSFFLLKTLSEEVRPVYQTATIHFQ